MTIYDRIRERRLELNMTQEELSEKMGYKTRSAINKIEKGLRDINQSKVAEFAKALECTPAYLMGWEDEAVDDFARYGLKPVTKKRIPMLGDIACGQPIFCNETYESYTEVDEDLDADFCLRAKGDSMINARIFDGDIVFIKKQSFVDNGDIAVVVIEDSATLKRVYKYENRIELRAENPTVPPINIEGLDMESVAILGKAVAFQSNVR